MFNPMTTSSGQMDIGLMDIMMPVMDGYQAYSKITAMKLHESPRIH